MKILIIRLSSIGDLVLTTPVIRAVRQQLDAEIHLLVKEKFQEVLHGNPYIAKSIFYEEYLNNKIDLKDEAYDLIIDLHNNWRTKRLRRKLGVRSISYNKENIRKWILTNFKLNSLPKEHLVDRYFAAIRPIGVENDHRGLDFIVSSEARAMAKQFIPGSAFIAIPIGAAHQTKVPPISIYLELIQNLDHPCLLLGGPGDFSKGEEIASKSTKEVLNLAGKLSLAGTAAIIERAAFVITPDTGLMHIAAALGKNIVSVWGNTVPEFGMYPYFPKDSIALDYRSEVQNLSCRPCSKIGYEKCPKGHFKCMLDQNITEIGKVVKKNVQNH
jgi:ADP-heptose:LPS heptosyltransferase